jgi:hypothetical protein
MNETIKSPKIIDLSWGRVEVDGMGEFKDVKLYPGGARAWEWGETGTEHIPGVQYSDVEELLEHGAKVVVLTRGVLGRLNVMPETVTELQNRGITVHVLKTNKAVEKYNQLRENFPVGGLFHSTC